MPHSLHDIFEQPQAIILTDLLPGNFFLEKANKNTFQMRSIFITTFDNSLNNLSWNLRFGVTETLKKVANTDSIEFL